jgi:hypothetical protein
MTRNLCPTCGTAIETDDPHGLCPACLLKGGLASQTGDASSTTPAAPVEGDALRKALEEKLRGQYRLIRLLGQGGMGAVYLARDLTLDREVAIKVVKTSADGPAMYDRFRREARTAAKLSHPNIVPLHAFGEVEGMPYFVMGYVRGESLAARLRRDGRLSEEEGRRVFAEIASALDHAHRQGVVHRDIKPDNVLLDDESGRALLTDFGVARPIGQGETLTRFGTVVGTPHYMSPEQAAGRADLDGRSDLYSLGVMAYAMFAGRLPFEGTSPSDVLTKHLTQQPAPLRPLVPALSDSTAQAVERCLAKDPADRWPDARSLEQALGGVPEAGPREGPKVVEGYGAIALIATLYVGSVIVGGWIDGDRRETLLMITAVNALALAVAYLFMLMRLRMRGHSVRETQRAFWTEPSWWPTWYPRALRRRGNVWDRLPAGTRALRWWFAWTLLATFLMPMPIVTGRFDVRPGQPLFRGVPELVLALLALMVLWTVLHSRARNELRRKGLTGDDVRRVAYAVAPSMVTFWSKPHISAILAPATSTDIRAKAGSPHEDLQAILRHAGELSGPMRSLGTQAAVAARQLVASIEQAEQQIADLARMIEPGEENRLLEKIEAISGQHDGADDYAALRSLLEQQLELIRGLAARIEEAKDRRNRRMEMLHMLTLHVASLRARSADTPSDVGAISDTVRSLCDQIAQHAMAAEPTVPMTTPNGRL